MESGVACMKILIFIALVAAFWFGWSRVTAHWKALNRGNLSAFFLFGLSLAGFGGLIWLAARLF